MALRRTAITTLCRVFNTNHMVHEYVVSGYMRAGERRARLEQDDFRRARELARWKKHIRNGWRDVQVSRVKTTLPEHMHVGGTVDVRTWIRTGTLAPADVAPQVYLGKLHEGRDIVEPEIVPMENQGATTSEGVLLRAVIRAEPAARRDSPCVCCRTTRTSDIPTRPASTRQPQSCRRFV